MPSPRLTKGRWSQCGHVYAVTMICVHRRHLFADAAHVALLADALRQLEVEGRVEHYAWVAMPDHVHWLFRLCDAELSQAVRLLKGRTSRAIGGAAIWQAGLATAVGVYPHAWCA